jgi:pyruvate formate-lyase/glycerol dehydratase family glycyl radical enzyme
MATKMEVANDKRRPAVINYSEVDKINVLTDRVSRLIKRRQEAVEHICFERSRLATESWRETEGEPLDIRRAKLFRRIMQGNPIAIGDDELIVGSQSQYVLGASPYVDYAPDVAIENMNRLSEMNRAERLTGGSSARKVLITEEEIQSILEDCRYWTGRSTADAVHREEAARFPFLKDWIDSGLAIDQQTGAAPPQGRPPDYGKVINIGLEGIIAEAKEALNKLDYSDNPAEDYNKDCFLQAVIIACEGAIEYAHRYARLAEEMAAKEKNPGRKKELERIAEVCQRVPAKPARNFYEALQSFWFIHICVNLETASIHEIPGRMDQYLYSIYTKDVLEEGNTSRQEAAELLGCLFVKFNEMTSVRSAYDRDNIPGTHLQDLTICGVTSDGIDASNELSYMLLEVLAQVQYPQPPIYIRYHNKINPEVWLKAVEVNVRRGDGNPAFVNDEVRIISFVDHDIALKDARNWGVAGCAGAIVLDSAMHGGSMGTAYISLSKIFEYVLNNGREPKSGKKIGLATGDPHTFTSIDQFIEAFKQQFSYVISLMAKMSHVVGSVDVANYRVPFVSALIGDCIAKGMDARKGGTRYPQFLFHVSDRGLQNVADSLAAIKKVVFEDKKLSLDEVLDAVSKNFEGKEDLRNLLKAAPKYGNDDDYVDEIFSDLSLWTQHRIGEEKNAFGSRLWTGRSGAVVHVLMGQKTGALPDGRKAGEPLADGFLSPSQGMDVKGPTAVFNSASKVNHGENNFAALMNMKFDRKIFNNRANIIKLGQMIESFFKNGGFHIQINILGKETLIEAQKHPEQYGNLLVRVAGYSAFFVDLPREIQDEIISRTEELI